MSGSMQKMQHKVSIFRVRDGKRGESRSITVDSSLESLMEMLDARDGGPVVKGKLKQYKGEKEMRLYLGAEKGFDPFYTAGRRKAAAALAVQTAIDQFAAFPEVAGAVRNVREQLSIEVRKNRSLSTDALKDTLQVLKDAVAPDSNDYRRIQDFCEMSEEDFLTWCGSTAPDGSNLTQAAARQKDLAVLQQYFQARNARVTSATDDQPQPHFKIVREHKDGADSENTIALKDVAIAFENLTTHVYGLERFGENNILLALCDAGKAFLANRPVFSDEAFGSGDVAAVVQKLRPDDDAKRYPSDAIRTMAKFLYAPDAWDIAKNNRDNTIWTRTIAEFTNHIVSEPECLERFLCTTPRDVALGIGSALLDDRYRMERDAPELRNTVAYQVLADNAFACGARLAVDIRTAVIAEAKKKQRLIRRKEAVERVGRRVAALWSHGVSGTQKIFHVHRRPIAAQPSRANQPPDARETAEKRRAVLKELRRHADIAKAVPSAVAKPQGFAVLDADPSIAESEIGLLTEASRYGTAADVMQALNTGPSPEQSNEFRMEMLWRATNALQALHVKGIGCIDARPENMAVFRNAMDAKGTNAKGSNAKSSNGPFDIRFASVRHVTRARVVPVTTAPADFRWQAPEWINGDPVDGFDAKKADAWALGIFVYQLFHAEGELPFPATDAAEMKRVLRTFQKNFRKPDGKIAKDGLNGVLIERMGGLARLLDPDPATRMSVAEAFKLLQSQASADRSGGTFISETRPKALQRLWERCDLVQPKTPATASSVPGSPGSSPKGARGRPLKEKKADRGEDIGRDQASTNRSSTNLNGPRPSSPAPTGSQSNSSKPIDSKPIDSKPIGSKPIGSKPNSPTPTGANPAIPPSRPRVPLGRRSSQPVLPAPLMLRQPSLNANSESLVESSSEQESQADAPRLPHSPGPVDAPPKPLPPKLEPLLNWKFKQWRQYYPEGKHEMPDLIGWLKAYSEESTARRSTGERGDQGRPPSQNADVLSKDRLSEIFEKLVDIDPQKESRKWRASYEATHIALMDFYQDLQRRDEVKGPFKYAVDGTRVEDASTSESD